MILSDSSVKYYLCEKNHLHLIRKISFVLVLLSFILIPYIKHLSIFKNPIFVTGKPDIKHCSKYDKLIEVYYQYNGKTYKKSFSKEFAKKEKVKLAINRYNPKDVTLFSFLYLYMKFYVIIPFVLVFLIAAIFVTDSQTKKDITFDE